MFCLFKYHIVEPQKPTSLHRIPIDCFLQQTFSKQRQQTLRQQNTSLVCDCVIATEQWFISSVRRSSWNSIFPLGNFINYMFKIYWMDSLSLSGAPNVLFTSNTTAPTGSLKKKKKKKDNKNASQRRAVNCPRHVLQWIDGYILAASCWELCYDLKIATPCWSIRPGQMSRGLQGAAEGGGPLKR